MEGQHILGLGEAGVEPVVEHRLGALPDFFGGWRIITRVPDHSAFRLASCWAVPIHAVMWVSWPQACITPVSVPFCATARTLEA